MSLDLFSCLSAPLASRGVKMHNAKRKTKFHSKLKAIPNFLFFCCCLVALLLLFLRVVSVALTWWLVAHGHGCVAERLCRIELHKGCVWGGGGACAVSGLSRRRSGIVQGGVLFTRAFENFVRPNLEKVCNELPEGFLQTRL